MDHLGLVFMLLGIREVSCSRAFKDLQQVLWGGTI